MPTASAAGIQIPTPIFTVAGKLFEEVTNELSYIAELKTLVGSLVDDKFGSLPDVEHWPKGFLWAMHLTLRLMLCLKYYSANSVKMM